MTKYQDWESSVAQMASRLLITKLGVSPEALAQAWRFLWAGLLVTACHALIVVAMIHLVSPRQVLANGVAFVVANILSYVIHTHWSFSKKADAENFGRFFVVSLLGLATALTIASLADHYRLPYLVGLGCVLVSIPPVTFLLHRYWTYR